VVSVQRLASYTSQQNSSVCDHNTRLFANGANFGGDIAKSISKPAGHVVASSYIPCAGHIRQPTFTRQASGKPIRLAPNIVINSGKSKGFEPPRGSWAHVSSRIVSIHDYGPPFVQTFGALSIKAFKRDVDRVFDMFVFILTARKDLD